MYTAGGSDVAVGPGRGAVRPGQIVSDATAGRAWRPALHRLHGAASLVFKRRDVTFILTYYVLSIIVPHSFECDTARPRLS